MKSSAAGTLGRQSGERGWTWDSMASERTDIGAGGGGGGGGGRGQKETFGMALMSNELSSSKNWTEKKWKKFQSEKQNFEFFGCKKKSGRIRRKINWTARKTKILIFLK